VNTSAGAPHRQLVAELRCFVRVVRIGLLAGLATIAHDSGTFAELRNDQLRIWTSSR
jgi:hypothetical protein